MRFVALILMSSMLACADSKFIFSPKQEGGPKVDEWLVEYKSMPEAEAKEIINDLGIQITWKWTRIAKVDSNVVLLGDITKSDIGIIATLYHPTKIDGKWIISGKGHKIKTDL